MLMVRHVMLRNVVTTDPKTSIKAAIETLYKKHIGSLLITDNDQKCVGIFTERDVIRVVAQGVNLDTPIEEAMTSNVITIGEEASLEARARYNHLIECRIHQSWHKKLVSKCQF
jgi:CBS domain-containing protein